MNTTKLDTLAAQIKTAPDLYTLHDLLIQFEDAGATDEDDMNNRYFDPEYELGSRGVDICSLPVFGGPDPKSTEGVWSWDEDEILAGEGPFCEWEIRPRKVEAAA